MAFSKSARLKAHSPAANKKRKDALGRISAYKKRHGITSKKLSAAQLAEAHRGFEMHHKVRKGDVFIKGSMPLGAISGQRPDKPGAQGAHRAYLTAQRVALAHDAVKLIDRLTRKPNPSGTELSRGLISMVNRLLNSAP